tara:strand:+ start:355 stop:597 length:243 start_codon:yes stop_codon:yes gene_type:complete
MRDFSITRKKGELYDVRVVDSYGKKYQNYFECASKANDWIYYIWEKEDWFNSQNSQELLAKAISECVKIDEENGRKPSLD